MALTEYERQYKREWDREYRKRPHVIEMRKQYAVKYYQEHKEEFKQRNKKRERHYQLESYVPCIECGKLHSKSRSGKCFICYRRDSLLPSTHE